MEVLNGLSERLFDSDWKLLLDDCGFLEGQETGKWALSFTLRHAPKDLNPEATLQDVQG